MAEAPVPEVRICPESRDAMQATPQHHRLLLKSERVRASAAWVAPGDMFPVQPHRWPSALHVLSACRFGHIDPKRTIVFDSHHGAAARVPGSTWRSVALPPHVFMDVGAYDIRMTAVEITR